MHSHICVQLRPVHPTLCICKNTRLHVHRHLPLRTALRLEIPLLLFLGTQTTNPQPQIILGVSLGVLCFWGQEPKPLLLHPLQEIHTRATHWHPSYSNCPGAVLDRNPSRRLCGSGLPLPTGLRTGTQQATCGQCPLHEWLWGYLGGLPVSQRAGGREARELPRRTDNGGLPRCH